MELSWEQIFAIDRLNHRRHVVLDSFLIVDPTSGRQLSIAFDHVTILFLVCSRLVWWGFRLFFTLVESSLVTIPGTVSRKSRRSCPSRCFHAEMPSFVIARDRWKRATHRPSRIFVILRDFKVLWSKGFRIYGPISNP